MEVRERPVPAGGCSQVQVGTGPACQVRGQGRCSRSALLPYGRELQRQKPKPWTPVAAGKLFYSLSLSHTLRLPLPFASSFIESAPVCCGGAQLSLGAMGSASNAQDFQDLST